MGIPNNSKKGFDIDIIDIPGIETPQEPPPPSSPPSTNSTSAIDSTEPPDIALNEETGEQIDGTVASIIGKMKKKGDFPSFSMQIASVNRILHMQFSSAKDIADVITRDFSLSLKLLKLVNSSFYGNFSSQGIYSIADAILILGTDCIQQAAASLMLFELLQQNSHNDELKDVALANFMSGLIAKDLSGRKGYYDTEKFLICAMFHNLGQVLTLFYFPEKYEQINRLITEEQIEKNKAARSVLGVTYWELGIGIAETWGLPEDIIRTMKPVTGDITKEPDTNDMLRCISSFSNALCDIARGEGGLNNTRQIAALLSRFEGIIDVSLTEIGDIISTVYEKIKAQAVQLNINTQKSRLLNQIGNANLKQRPLSITRSPEKSGATEQRLTDKMKEISDVINEGHYKIGDVMMMVLDTMEKEFNYTRVAMCIKSLDANQIIVRYALGKDPDMLKKNFKFTISIASDDIFNAALNEGSDVIINDVTHKKYGKLIPKWYAELNISTGFSIYPILVNKVVFGLFYADTDSVDLKQFMRQHDYMKKLRTLTVKAIKHISSA